MIKKTGGATFDPNNKFIYFIATGISQLAVGAKYQKNILCAVNEIGSEKDVAELRSMINQGNNLFIDSGVYNLAMEHVRKHGVSHNVALNMAPDEIDGFDKLFDKYVTLMRDIGEDSWGYIEIDQGGRENKIKTRAKLEGLGLRPIPVYHPFADGWDYFDELASNYDRICFGNVVQADQHARIRLVATAWERMRKYPNLWIHLLGLTPNQWLNAFPISSGDSSSWLSSVRWSGYIERTNLKSMGILPKNFQYKLGGNDSVEYMKAIAMSAYGAGINQRNWKNHITALQAVGCDPLPEVL